MEEAGENESGCTNVKNRKGRTEDGERVRERDLRWLVGINLHPLSVLKLMRVAAQWHRFFLSLRSKDKVQYRRAYQMRFDTETASMW